MDLPFRPEGPTFLVGTTAVNVVQNAHRGASFRVVNTAAAAHRLNWGADNTVTSAAPVAGTPVYRTVLMPAGAIEVLGHIGPWLIGDTGSAFEITQGSGGA